MERQWNSGEILIVLGPRQVGKTTLLEQLCGIEGDFLLLNGDDIVTERTLKNIGEVQLRQLIGKQQTVFF